MQHTEIRAKFRAFMESRGHRWVDSSSLLPDDPSVLFTTAGMQQFKPYYTGAADAQTDFGALNTSSIQKCVRTSDIDEVGDQSHLTFFEMLGNFSFGGYWKRKAIEYAATFLMDKEAGMGIDYRRIHTTYFAGDPDLPGITNDIEAKLILENNSFLKEKVVPGGKDNFWGPTGVEGPCGPTVEFYVDGIEVWNVVFNEFYKGKDGVYTPLSSKGIDTGMGLERLAMASQAVATVFETDLLAPIIAAVPTALGEREKRIVADHARTVSFLIADGVRPSNKDQGYVLRRLLRRIMVHLAAADGYSFDPFAAVLENYRAIYPNLDEAVIRPVIEEEEAKFSKTVKQGMKELGKLSVIDASSAFKLYESYGLPYELIKDIAGPKAEALTREAFDEKFKEHQAKSRAGAVAKFGGHGLLLDTGELKAANEEELRKVTRLHTATHLLHAALRRVLGTDVSQAGSDITPERTRFDFTFPRKLTDDELTKVSELVNDAITRDLPVAKVTLPKAEAERTGALHFFKVKYPPMVDVYSVGDFSKEFCGGPHVTRTGEIGSFTIVKEEGVSAGVRRIRATVTP